MVTVTEVRKAVKYWRKRLQLEDWVINVKINNVAKELGDDESSPLASTKASCQAFPEYKKALLEFDKRLIEPEDLDAYVIHELLHCHIWRLAACPKSVTTFHEEDLTSAMERLVLSLTTERTCRRKSTGKKQYWLRPNE